MPATVTWNPGEFVFDMTTGEPYIDAEGNTFEVEPHMTIQAASGRVIDGDDVANAAYYRANKYEGETLRARSIGVPYLRLALGQGDIGQAVTAMVAEVRRRTPGVAGVVSLRDVRLDARTRIITFACTLLRNGGQDQPFSTIVG
jgi:hypothetical protein